MKEEKGRKNYNVLVDCSTQPNIKRVKLYFSELRDYHDIHTVAAEKTETYTEYLRSQTESGRAGICSQLVSLQSDTNKGTPVTGLCSEVIYRKRLVSPLCIRTYQTM